MSRALLVVCVTLVTACATPDPQPPVPEGVELTAAGFRLASTTAAFQVLETTAERVVLVPSTAAREGRVVVEAGPPGEGLNLVAAVQDHEDEIESRPEGDYAGAQELQGAAGAAFYSRGRFRGDDGTEIEELKIFSLHPAGDRRIDVVATYPAGDDSAERVTELLHLLGEVEGLPSTE